MPTIPQDGQPQTTEPLAVRDWDEWEERAAIVEFDGYEARDDAERRARRESQADIGSDGV